MSAKKSEPALEPGAGPLAAIEAVEPDPAHAETEERFARDEADHLPAHLLEDFRARRTGAKEAAFFDLDKTVIARSSTLVYGPTFMRDGLISPATVLKGVYAQAVYQLVGADTEKMEQMRHALLDLTKGWDAERVNRIVNDTVEDLVVPLVYSEAMDLIREHRRLGRDVWLVSSSGDEIVRPMGKLLGVTDVIATRAGIDAEGLYDGTLEFYAYGRAKANAVEQLAEVRGYDLDRCYAYSDSITDLPFLDAVGNPVAANPDRELRAAAEAMGWEIRDFHSPMTLRDRLPEIQRPPNNILVGAAAVLAVALIGWRYLLRRED